MEHTDQLGFDDLLASADCENQTRKFEREAAHLPGSMDEALPFFRALIEQHHAAMLAADVDEAMRLRQEADLLAQKLDVDNCGILAHEDAPGCVLERETAADRNAVPLWGQSGDFAICVDGMKVRIELEGVFGIGSGFYFWPGFSAHALDESGPFLSQTGYRSFLGIRANSEAGLSPDRFAAKVIASYVERALKGKLLSIEPRYRERREDRS